MSAHPTVRYCLGLLATLAGIAACGESGRPATMFTDRPAEALPDRPWPGYSGEEALGRSADTVRVQYTVDSLGSVDSASMVVVRAADYSLERAVRESLSRTRFRPAVKSGRPVSSTIEERYVLLKDSTVTPDSLVVVRSTSDSIPEYILGAGSGPRPLMSVAWSDVRHAYQAVLAQLLETSTLTDSTQGLGATICLGSISPYGRSDRDTAALALVKRRGRNAIPIEECPPYSGMSRFGAPPPKWKPGPGAPAPVYIQAWVESWTDGALWIRGKVVQHHGVRVHLCEARGEADRWAASCRFASAYIF